LKKKPVAKSKPKEEILEGTALDVDTNDNIAVVEIVEENVDDAVEVKVEEVTAEVAEVTEVEPIETYS